MAEKSSIIIEYKNGLPIELLDLTRSLSAIGDQFKRYVTHESGIDADARLFIHEIRSGSTIAELVAYGQSAIDLYEATEKLGGFAPYMYQLLQDVLHLRPASKTLDKPTVRNVANIVRPTAIDNSGHLNIIENNGGTVNVFNSIGPTEAAAIAHNANHLLNSEFPQEQRFSHEPMILYQLRDAPPGKTGDFGIIDAFSDRPRKLFFGSEELKSRILTDQPFESVFWVDGVVKTAGGKVEGYQVLYLHETTPRHVN